MMRNTEHSPLIVAQKKKKENNNNKDDDVDVDEGGIFSSASATVVVLKRTLVVLAVAGVTVLAVAQQQQRGGEGQRNEMFSAKYSRLGKAGVSGYPTSTYSVPKLFDMNVFQKKEGVDFPIFLHIPKSGGTSVESMVGVVGGKVGSCNSADLGGTRPFDIERAWVVGGAEDFHSPPSERHLKNSFVTVRNPYARAESEFAWFRARYFSDQPLDVGYSDTNCKLFSEWLHTTTQWVLNMPLIECYHKGGYADPAMEQCNNSIKPTENEIYACVDKKTSGGMAHESAHATCSDELGVVTYHHSHHVPAYVIARHAEYVFPLETCLVPDVNQQCTDPRTGKSQNNLVKFLQNRISQMIQYKAMNVVSRGTEIGHAVKPSVTECWTNGKISNQDINNFKAAYAIDFQKYGYSNAVPTPGYDQDTHVSLGEKKMKKEEVFDSKNLGTSSSPLLRASSTTRKLLKTNELWPVVEDFGTDSEQLEFYPSCPPPDWDAGTQEEAHNLINN